MLWLHWMGISSHSVWRRPQRTDASWCKLIHPRASTTMAKSAQSFPALTTRRLNLRRVEARDAPALHACFGDLDAMQFWNFPASRTMGDTEKILTWLSKTSSPYDHLAWAISERSNDQCIGMVNYNRRDARNRRLEIGYIVARKHQRNGIGSEAVQALLDYCAEKLSVHRLDALIHPDNTASIRLVERLGFHCEGGPLTDYWCVDGRFLSVMIYARINPGSS